MKDENRQKRRRLKNLKIRGVAIVDTPAIEETFYLFKNLGGKEVKSDQKVVIKTLDEIEQEFISSTEGIHSKIADVKSILEEYAQKTDTPLEMKEAFSKSINILVEIEDMERGNPFLAFAQDSIETIEKQEKNVIPIQGQIEEILKTISGFSDDFKTFKKSIEEGFIKSMVQEVVGGFVGQVEGLVGGIVQKIDLISQEVEKKADKSEVPLRKGFGPSGKELRSDEPAPQHSLLERVTKSKEYQSASPGRRLLMLTRHFVENQEQA